MRSGESSGTLVLVWIIAASFLILPSPAVQAQAAPASAPATQAASGPIIKLTIGRQTPPPSPYVSDDEIGQAIDKGAAFLKSQFIGGRLKGFDMSEAVLGPGGDALAVYALLQCGLASSKDGDLDAKSDFMKSLLDNLKGISLDGYKYATYTRGIRLTALALVNRKEDRGTMAVDVDALLDGCQGGAWDYITWAGQAGSRREHQYAKAEPHGDHSNSQYGLLGIWSAAEVGAEIPDDFWSTVEKHWTQTQMASGQWNYGVTPATAGEARTTMTCAGIASLFVCHDYLDVAKFGDQVGREPFSPALVKGLDWLEKGDNCTSNNCYHVGYNDYGFERVGLASGFKYFGSHDWYRERSTRMVKKQQANGSWVESDGPILDTTYYLLFLARGRHPIIMNKLRFEHFWANRPRDLAHLSKFAHIELEKVFNWQVVTLQHDWFDWLDSPILFIASHTVPKLTDADFAKIRAYVDGGGMLFTQADGGTAEFSEYVHNVLAKKVFPDYELGRVPDTHDLFTVQMQTKVKPRLEMITNGSRVLMVHCPIDISMYWQQDASKSHADAFQTAMNLFVYAAGKSDFSNRIASAYIPDPPAVAGNEIKVARVKYPQTTWNPEPYAWKRFANYMGWETSVNIKTQEVEIEALGVVNIAEMPLAHLTGTNAYSPTPAQLKSLRQYVDNGGTLLLDACGGGTFNESISKMISGAFADRKAETFGIKSPLFAAGAPGMVDLPKLKMRPVAMRIYGVKPPALQVIKSGRGRVIYSSLDLTSSLLGSKTWGIVGYDGPTALAMMRNIVCWTAAGAPEGK